MHYNRRLESYAQKSIVTKTRKDTVENLKIQKVKRTNNSKNEMLLIKRPRTS